MRELKKKLEAETRNERFKETEAFVAKATEHLKTNGLGSNPEWIEIGLRQALMHDGNAIIASIYNDRELLPDNAEPKPLETVHRNRSRSVCSLFGEFELQRNYFHHAKSGSGRFPLDDTLGLEGACTPAIARLMCKAATQSGSYQEAADDLAAYAGVCFNAHDLGRMVQSLAPKLCQALETMPKPSPHKPIIDVLYATCDGTGTPMRREELKGRKGKQEDGTARTSEAKIGCIFTQTDLDSHGKPLRDEEGAPLRDPDSTSYVGTYQGCRQIAVLLHQEAHRRGLDRAKRVVFIGDGAAWVWENARQTFPDAIEILDFYHASEHVGKLADAIHDQNSDQSAALRQRWCHEMKQSSPASLLDESRTLLAANPLWSEDKIKAIQGQINYLENHSSRTHYGRYRQEGLFIGSGVVEAACKTVVGRRLKQSGMFWSHTGAENILSLRCLVLGPHFDSAWNELRTLKIKEQMKARRWLNGEIEKAA